MRVHVVSDVHGAADALARAGEGADALVVLGDLIDFIDYADPAGGIVGRVLGPAVSARFALLRRSGARGELLAYAREAWAAVPDAEAVIDEALREQYDRLFAAMTTPTWAIPGNVDVARLWPGYRRPGLCQPDGQVVEIGGLRFGFAGGAPLPPGRRPGSVPSAWTPDLRPQAEYDAAVRALVDVDVLCSHVPPAVAELAYDVVTRRPETSSVALREVVARDRPRAALFGHVHQPLAARVRVDRTECVNVGYFRRTGAPYVLRW
ncbi:metallophosphoesterase family protein [Pseudonocardia humida]|uniref:Metallophosphoesterase family protein n=1 Tax=Pseudonocardia humida TaxID=2800819 RepID=A0ABT0ZYN4_9PSEU|nr:metallophosphoesterase [Pseudonocardia humida]MCO1655855.1 metallophosphoesterase family protein [Pseudonocardia humida]